MSTPDNAVLKTWLENQEADVREFFEERAAIREHDAGLSRSEAELLAWADTRVFIRRKTRNFD
ncbi:hypothetical protein KSF73_01355 [Burkholderiaceae bacterium DAT-1]|nr:hypothetical protein [Burkholderiaceae bacterium DAT-1]